MANQNVVFSDTRAQLYIRTSTRNDYKERWREVHFTNERGLNLLKYIAPTMEFDSSGNQVSYEIHIPETPEMFDLFEQMDDPNSITALRGHRHEARISFRGQHLYGEMVIERKRKNIYVATFTEGNIEWWRPLTELRLSDLDWSDSGMSEGTDEDVWGPERIKELHHHRPYKKGDSPIFWGVKNYGKIDHPDKLKASEMRPDFYLKAIWDKIIARTGIKFKSRFFESDFFASLLANFSFSISDVYDQNYLRSKTHVIAGVQSAHRYKGSFAPNGAVTHENQQQLHPRQDAEHGFVLRFRQFNFHDKEKDAHTQFDTNKRRLEIRYTGTYKLHTSFEIGQMDGDRHPSKLEAAVYIVRLDSHGNLKGANNGILAQYSTFPRGAQGGVITENSPFGVRWKGELEAGDFVAVNLYIGDVSTNSGFPYDFTLSKARLEAELAYPKLGYDTPLPIGRLLPRSVMCTDIVRAVTQMFNIQFIVRKDEIKGKWVEAEPYADEVEPKHNFYYEMKDMRAMREKAQDWTRYLDKDHETIFRYGGRPTQYHDFKFKEDSTDIAPTDTHSHRHQMRISMHRTVIKTHTNEVFAPTVSFIDESGIWRNGTDSGRLVPRMWNAEPDNGVYPPKSYRFKPRVFEKKQHGGSWALDDNKGGVLRLPHVFMNQSGESFGRKASLSFDDLFDRFYSKNFKQIARLRKVFKAIIPWEVYRDLDFRKPIVLNYRGTEIYRVISIQEYRVNGTALARLKIEHWGISSDLEYGKPNPYT